MYSICIIYIYIYMYIHTYIIDRSVYIYIYIYVVYVYIYIYVYIGQQVQDLSGEADRKHPTDEGPKGGDHPLPGQQTTEVYIHCPQLCYFVYCRACMSLEANAVKVISGSSKGKPIESCCTRGCASPRLSLRLPPQKPGVWREGLRA